MELYYLHKRFLSKQNICKKNFSKKSDCNRHGIRSRKKTTVILIKKQHASEGEINISKSFFHVVYSLMNIEQNI